MIRDSDDLLNFAGAHSLLDIRRDSKCSSSDTTVHHDDAFRERLYGTRHIDGAIIR